MLRNSVRWSGGVITVLVDPTRAVNALSYTSNPVEFAFNQLRTLIKQKKYRDMYALNAGYIYVALGKFRSVIERWTSIIFDLGFTRAWEGCGAVLVGFITWIDLFNLYPRPLW